MDIGNQCIILTFVGLVITGWQIITLFPCFPTLNGIIILAIIPLCFTQVENEKVMSLAREKYYKTP